MTRYEKTLSLLYIGSICVITGGLAVLPFFQHTHKPYPTSRVYQEYIQCEMKLDRIIEWATEVGAELNALGVTKVTATLYNGTRQTFVFVERPHPNPYRNDTIFLWCKLKDAQL